MNSRAVAALCCASSLVALALLVEGARYEWRPGRAGARPVTWPVESRLPLRGRPTLVLFAHPKCACTRASLEQLARIVARTDGRADAVVAFLDPEDAGRAWVETDTWHQARRLAGVTVVRDAAGAEAQRFGARTSGDALVFDASGVLRYAGGLTAGRGNARDNAGADAALASLIGARAAEPTLPAFGCPLVSDRSDKKVSQ